MAELAMTDSGRLKHKVVTHPASSLAQDRESLLAETSILTTMLRRQLYVDDDNLPEHMSYSSKFYHHLLSS